MGWNYAELSKMAKENGGPEKLIDTPVNSGKKQMVPWLGVAALGGAAITVSIQKIVKYFSKKKAKSDAEFEKAKQELIQGIYDYDASHDDKSLDREDNENNAD